MTFILGSKGGKTVIMPDTDGFVFIPEGNNSYYVELKLTLEKFQEEHGEKDEAELIDLFSSSYPPEDIRVACNLSVEQGSVQSKFK